MLQNQVEHPVGYRRQSSTGENTEHRIRQREREREGERTRSEQAAVNTSRVSKLDFWTCTPSSEPPATVRSQFGASLHVLQREAVWESRSVRSGPDLEQRSEERRSLPAHSLTPAPVRLSCGKRRQCPLQSAWPWTDVSLETVRISHFLC